VNDQNIKIEYINQNGERIHVADANAKYGPHGESYRRQRFSLIWGDEIADCIGGAILDFGRKVASGYPVTSTDYEFGGIKWTLSV
jgi:hypothetical protein